MDADGSGRKQFQLPNDGYINSQFESSVSPDGEWLAYYTGSSEEPYDLALNLFSLFDETSLLISNIIAPGFPENLEPVTETIYFTEYDTDCPNDPRCRLGIVQSAFQQGMWHSIDWSPDSKSLAFAAQIDGASSDIYIFSVENQSIRRLTNELENIWEIDWSPIPEKILYKTSVPGTIYLSQSLYVVDVRIGSAQNPDAIDRGTFWFTHGWVDENLYLTYNGGEGAPPNHFRIIDIKTHQVKQIWEYSAETFFVDLKRQVIIISPYGRIYLEDEPEVGIYVVSFSGDYHKVSDEFVYFIEGQDAVHRYFASDQKHQLVSVSIDGEVTQLSRRVDYYVPPKSSPDGKWTIITSENETELYSEDIELIKSLGIHATDIIWRPDSAGAFLYSDPTLYYLSMDDMNLSEICIQDSCRPFDYVWLP